MWSWPSTIVSFVFLYGIVFLFPAKECNASSSESDKMWAVQISKFGEPSEVINVGWVPKPTVEENNDILVRVDARPINPSDLLFIRGLYKTSGDFPTIPGAEGTGIVEAVGKKVSKFRKGDRVSFWSGYSTKSGSWAEFIVLPDNLVCHVNKGLPVEAAAQIVLNPLTMIGIMKQFGEVKPGEYVIQNAANSACGKFLVQYLKAKGVKTINVIRHSESSPLLEALGADEVITLDSQDLKSRVDAITQNKGVKYAVDAVWGQNTVNTMVNTLSPKGKLINYGVLGGVETPVNVVPLLFGLRSIQGYHVDFFLESISLKEKQSLIFEVGKMLLQKKIVLPTESFRPRQVREAIKHSETTKKPVKTLIVGTSLD